MAATSKMVKNLGLEEHGPPSFLAAVRPFLRRRWGTWEIFAAKGVKAAGTPSQTPRTALVSFSRPDTPERHLSTMSAAQLLNPKAESRVRLQHRELCSN